MALVASDGIVLQTWPLGDTSRIVAAYTRDHGLRRFVAKGARQSPSRFGYALEPLSRSRFVYYLKPDRDLHLLSKAEVLDPVGSRLTDLTRLAHGQAAIELVGRLVWGEEPHPELYELLRATLEADAVAPHGALTAVTIAFELQVASVLGYRPRLDACVGCGRPISPRRLFSPGRGGLMCDRCAAVEPGLVALSADALAGLSLLLTRGVHEAGEYVEVRRAGEILRVVEAFLRHHFERFQGLRSLEVLRQIGHVADAAADPPDRADGPGGS